MPLIDRNDPTPFYQQLYEQIARGIDEGRYRAGSKLPSIRECARELDISNTTVELAYQRLTEEGYVETRRGSGYVVCQTQTAPIGLANSFSPTYQHAAEDLALAAGRRAADPDAPIRWDFAYDAIDSTLFPYATWARINRDVFFDQGVEAACSYNDRQGLFELREQISLYISREYGVISSPDQIIVMPTTSDLIAEIMELFDPVATTIAMEDPGYDEVASRLTRSGFNVRTLAVHPFPTWEQSRRMLDGANVLFATPANQFPSNASMPVDMRRELVAWAESADVYLIDDEYGWELQTGAERMPPLASLDRSGRVITFGTFSNSFTPAVCLSYAVLPPQLMLKWIERCSNRHPKVPWQTQKSIATFMSEGHWRAHIRKLRTLTSRKRSALVDALDKHLGSRVHIRPGASSTYVLVQATDGRSEQDLVEAAAKAGVRVYPTSQYWRAPVPPDWRYVLIGYAGIALDDIDSGIRALADAWR